MSFYKNSRNKFNYSKQKYPRSSHRNGYYHKNSYYGQTTPQQQIVDENFYRLPNPSEEEMKARIAAPIRFQQLKENRSHFQINHLTEFDELKLQTEK